MTASMGAKAQCQAILADFESSLRDKPARGVCEAIASKLVSVSVQVADSKRTCLRCASLCNAADTIPSFRWSFARGANS